MHDFRSLDTRALFALMKLRVDVFVVEQNCAYAELDHHDIAENTLHLLGYLEDDLVAYARAMPENESSEPSGREAFPATDSESRKRVRIGRVVVARANRGHGIANALMRQLIREVERRYPRCKQQLAAQQDVLGFYVSLGFEPVSAVYLEDGIPHVDMLRTPASA